MKKHITALIISVLLVMRLLGCTQKSEIVPTEVFQSDPAVIATESVPPESSEASDTSPDKPPQTEAVITFETPAGSYLLRYDSQSTEDYLDYYLFIPENADYGMPLIVFLHGDGEVGNPEILKNYGLIEKVREIYGENFPFIVISPSTRVASWTAGTIPLTLKELIDHIAETYATGSIIITGHSRGAMGVWYMISEYGDYFSAAVPISCGTGTDLDLSECAKVPVLAFAGTIGEYENKYARRMDRIVSQITEAGGDANLIILDQADHSATATEAFTEETINWIISHNKE